MRKSWLLILFIFSAVVLQAEWNNPYPKKEAEEKVIYKTFSLKPKSLDPATSYVENEWQVACQIYEPLYQYKYLKRPFELEPLLASERPKVSYYDKEGNEIKDIDAYTGEIVSTWVIPLKKGVKFQNHPCFAKDAQGNFLYHHLKDSGIPFTSIFDLPEVGTREMTSKDFAYQIYRMADQRLHSPIFNIVLDKIQGMQDVSKGINEEIENIRKERLAESKKRGELIFNREEDEKQNPIVIDYLKIKCEGLDFSDDYVLKFTLTEKYPQFRYWLAMLFFSPIPWEAVHFYEQPIVKNAGYGLLQYPVGTGPFKFEKSNRNSQMILSKNENYREEFFPKEASPEFEHLLVNAGKKLPLADKIIWTREPEVTSQWLKFQQGYLEAAGIPEQSFTSAISLDTGTGELSEEMKAKGMQLIKAPRTSVSYIAFNMLDPIVGGYDEKHCKLRQAISIAIDSKELIEIYANGRGLPAQGPIPPGIFGNEEGEAGVNPYEYEWDAAKHDYQSKGIAYAKQLLKEAGYENGIDPSTGKSLVLFYDTVQSSSTTMEWYKAKLQQLNISLEFRTTDFNRLLEKLEAGSAQLFPAGWNADYPDPENFLALLYGPNGAVKFKGENKSNYMNPEFDKLFDQIKTMDNSPERLVLIKKALEIVRHDAPWKFQLYPVDYIIYHDWYQNLLAGGVINNASKYQDIAVQKRTEYRKAQNQPQFFWPLFIITSIGAIFFFTIYRFLKKEMH